MLHIHIFFSLLTAFLCYPQRSGGTIRVAPYNITADPYEKYDLSKKFPDMVEKFQDRVQSYMSGALPPANKPGDPKARQVAKENGAWTPWM